MHITLRQLRIFEAVARHGSMTRAAAEMHLTQPGVSMHMRQLEELVGVALFEREGRKPRLTEAGEELRIYAQRFAAQTLELELVMEQFRRLEHGVLRLAVVSTASYFVPPLIARLSERNPAMQISLQVGNRESVLAALTDRRVHLAITGQPPADHDLVAQHFMDNPLVVIAPPRHRFARMRALSMQDLAQETLVLREAGSGTRAAVERHFREHHLAIRPGCQLNTNEAIKQAVQAGLGLGVVPEQTIELEREHGRLVVLPVAGFPILRRWYFVHRRDRPLSPTGIALCDLLLGRDSNQPVGGRRTRTAMATG